MGLRDAEHAVGDDTLVELEGAGLIQVRQDGRRLSVTLAHPLYGEILRRGISPLARRRLLRPHIERLRSHGMRRREDALAVASFGLAAEGQADPALLLRGAAQARGACDYARVVDLIEALPDSARTWGELVMLGESLLQIGQSQRAEAALAQADSRAASEAEVVTTTQVRTWNLQYGNHAFERIIAVHEAARSRVTEGAHRRVLDLNEAAIRSLYHDPRATLPLLRTLGPTAAGEDPTAWFQGAVALTDALAVTGHALDAVEWADQAYAASQGMDADLLPDAANHLVAKSLALLEAGRVDDAAEVGETAFWAVAEHAGASKSWAATHTARAHWIAGRPATARRWYAQALSLARTHHYEQTTGLLLSGFAAAAAAMGDLAAADKALRQRDASPGSVLLRGEEDLGRAWFLACRVTCHGPATCCSRWPRRRDAAGTARRSASS